MFLCPENTEEPLRGFTKNDMIRIANSNDDPGCSCRMAMSSSGRVGVGGQSNTAVGPREPWEWHGEGAEEWERSALE